MTHARIAGISVLIVDDSRVVIKRMQWMLEQTGITLVDSATSSSEAEEKMRGTRYDVLFLDWHMAGKSGVALMEQCREDRAFDMVAFVIVSGEAGPRFIDEAMKAGATSYIVKPFTLEILLGASWQSRNLARTARPLQTVVGNGRAGDVLRSGALIPGRRIVKHPCHAQGVSPFFPLNKRARAVFAFKGRDEQGAPQPHPLTASAGPLKKPLVPIKRKKGAAKKGPSHGCSGLRRAFDFHLTEAQSHLRVGRKKGLYNTLLAGRR